MQLKNHTPFPAVAFQGVTPAGAPFYVVVLKQTYAFGADGVLTLCDEQAPLIETDQFAGTVNESAVLAESDFCHYKPRCDVLVNGKGYAPGSKPARRFTVRVQVRRPDQPAPLPEAPQGLNPYMPPPPERMQAWREAYALAQGKTVPGKVLLDKTLTVTGERWLRKRLLPVRMAQGLAAVLTLGLWRPNPWRLTAPKPCTSADISAANAFGGQAKVCASERAAKRVGKRHWLPGVDRAELVRQYREAGQDAALAHTHWDANHIGKGYAAAWQLRAARVKRLPAPQIERPGQPFTARAFWRVVRGKVQPGRQAAPLSVGLGVACKAWLPRRELLGTVDDAFIQSKAPLPADFDFGYWNAAPTDQQCAHLVGDEWIELNGLTPEGKTLLKLPGNELYVFARSAGDDIENIPLHIDTVAIDTDARRLSLTWRLAVAKEAANPITEGEACMLDAAGVLAHKAALTAMAQSLGIKEEAAHG